MREARLCKGSLSRFLLLLLVALLAASCAAPSATPVSRSQATATTAPLLTTTRQVATSAPTLTSTATARLVATPTPALTPEPTAAQVSSAPAGLLRVAFIDVGQGDSVLVVPPEGKAMLIDGGEADSGCLACLQGHGIKQLDLVVATHPYSDHIGGLERVLQAIPVAEVVTNG